MREQLLSQLHKPKADVLVKLGDEEGLCVYLGSKAHFLHRPLRYINPQTRTSPEALTKFAKLKNASPCSQAALPLCGPLPEPLEVITACGTKKRHRYARKERNPGRGIFRLQ
ncbi:unnamed protein product [Pleuronectes platessa]|uniref:Uncharacterized protein n=1 Tax=Pleuronectes platessa TaxID=8262 RepID=A0A9N7VLK2_PLEPL|nr:unnamed protein product [Pleuronectes platessa]